MRLVFFLVGAALGAPTRYLIDTYFRSQYRFPVGILAVNVLGSFLIGLVAEAQSNLAFGLLGFCGSLTTWSAFALDLFDTADRGRPKEFAVNLIANYGLGVVAALIGLWVAQ